MSNRKVPPVRIRTKDEVSDALASDWLRLAPQGARAAFSVNIGADPDGKTVSKAISGEHLPATHTVLNSLVVDPTALFNTLQLYGGVFVPIETRPVDDMGVILGMMQAATEYLDRMKDNQRCHVDTAVLAKMFRPLVPQMLAIIREANGGEKAELRAVA